MKAKGTYNSFELGDVLMLDYNSANKTSDAYYYIFDPEIPGWDNPGSFHSSDLWFAFETLAKCWRPFTGKHYDLARQMCNYWTNFAKTGNPNGLDADGTPMPEWKAYTSDQRGAMRFGDTPEMIGPNEDGVSILAKWVHEWRSGDSLSSFTYRANVGPWAKRSHKNLEYLEYNEPEVCMSKPLNIAYESFSMFFSPAYMQMRLYGNQGPKHYPSPKGVDADYDGNVTFTFYAPDAQSVSVCGTGGAFGSEPIAMTKGSEGNGP